MIGPSLGSAETSVGTSVMPTVEVQLLPKVISVVAISLSSPDHKSESHSSTPHNTFASPWGAAAAAAALGHSALGHPSKDGPGSTAVRGTIPLPPMPGSSQFKPTPGSMQYSAAHSSMQYSGQRSPSTASTSRTNTSVFPTPRTGGSAHQHKNSASSGMDNIPLVSQLLLPLFNTAAANTAGERERAAALDTESPFASSFPAGVLSSGGDLLPLGTKSSKTEGVSLRSSGNPSSLVEHAQGRFSASSLSNSAPKASPRDGQRSEAPSRRDTRAESYAHSQSPGGNRPTAGGGTGGGATPFPTTGPWAGQGHIVEIASRIMAEAEAAANREKFRYRATSEVQRGPGDDLKPLDLSSTGHGSLALRDSGLQLPLVERDSFPANSEILLEAYRKLALGGGGGMGGRLSQSPSLNPSPSVSAGGAPTPTLPSWSRDSYAANRASPGAADVKKDLSERLETGESLTGTSPFALMFDLQGAGPSTSFAPSTDTTATRGGGFASGYGGGFNQGTRKGSTAYEGYTDALQARMGGKVADLPLNPEVEFELDWAQDIVVFRDSLLGAGATGLVYRGLYQNREVAIKVIIPSSSSQGAAQMDPEDTESMQHELQIMARLTHPNIVRVYGGCMRPPNLFVVEEIMVS